MPDEIKNDSVTQVESKSTVEVLDPQGKTMGTSPLASLFDKMQAAKTAGEPVEKVLEPVVKQEAPASKVETSTEKKEDSPAEVKVEEKKVEDKPIDRRKLFEDTEVKKVEKPSTEVKTEPKDTDAIKDDELAVLPHDKPRTAKRIQALLAKLNTTAAEVTTTKAEAAEKAAKLAELERKLGEVKTVDPKVQEEITRKEEELAMYRRRYALDNDPEIKNRFDSKIESSEKEIPELLKRNGASEDLLKIIAEEGGWLKFSRSGRPITLSDGKTVTAAEFAGIAAEKIPFSDRTKLQALTMEQIQLQREKENFIKDESGKAKEYFTKQTEAQKKQQEEQQAIVQENAKKVEAWHKGFIQKTDWLNIKEVPANATAEQKAQIEEDNKYARNLNAIFHQSLAPKSLDESFAIVEDSIKYYHERRQNARLLAENAKLKADLEAKEKEIGKIKTSSRSTTRAGSIQGGGSGEEKPKGPPQGLEAALSLIAAGESLTNA